MDKLKYKIKTTNTVEYIESEIPQEEQKYQGWFYVWPQKAFYRWSDAQELARQYDRKQKWLSNFPDG